MLLLRQITIGRYSYLQLVRTLRSRPAATCIADVGKRGEGGSTGTGQARSAHVRDVSKITAQVGAQLACVRWRD
jgi:hypothetical protein